MARVCRLPTRDAITAIELRASLEHGYGPCMATNVDESLLEEARKVLGVGFIRQLRGGAQKAVQLVRRGTEDQVLKVVPLDGSPPDALRRAEREVELLGSLDSPYVVKVASPLVELGNPVQGAAWLEEYLDGTDLSSHLFTRQWPWEESKTLGLHVAHGLAVAHKAKVVHRDLSAGNVRRLASGDYKVMDFGFARHTLRSGLTVAGQPGTPGYASPEHLHSYSGAPTAASDVFAAGILMYVALTQQFPIPYGGDDADYARRLLQVEMADLAQLRPDLTGESVALVRRCLHPQPARRYLNGSRLADALEALA